MKPKVFYGSPHQSRLTGSETLPAKLDLILNELHLRDRVKDELVCIKLHVGNDIGYSVIHPVFVRKVVQAVLDGGGKPFVADVEWDVAGCETRGYTSEVLGCPVYPASGLKNNFYYEHPHEYKNLKTWKVAGMVEDATFMVNFAHVKGHPSCGFGGAIKNIALGCMVGDTRSQMHDTNHYDKYWFKEKCSDRAVMQKIVDACPFEAVVFDKKNPEELHVHFEPCNQCGRCLKVAPPGSLKIDPVNFQSFQEACAISTAIVMSTFAKEKAVHLALANQMTPVCDCFGFTGMSILNDEGIFGSDDIVALDKAVLDKTADLPLIYENIPDSIEPQDIPGHPFAKLHGPYKDPYDMVRFAEKYGVGSQDYELVDVLPYNRIRPAGSSYYIAAK